MAEARTQASELRTDLFDCTKINQHDAAIAGAANEIRGFNVAVDDAMVVDKGQNSQQIAQKRDHLGLGPGGTQLLRQGMALDKLLGQVKFLIFFEVGQQPRNLRVRPQLVEGLGLGVKQPPRHLHLVNRGDLGLELLDHTQGMPRQVQVLGAKGLAEAPCPQGLNQPVATP